MKRLLRFFIIATVTFFTSISAQGQSLNNTKWEIFEVHDSRGFTRNDISVTGGRLYTTAKVLDNKLYLGKDVYRLCGEKVVKNNFALENSYRFMDQYEQKGDVLFVEDPLYVKSDYRYVIFIKYDNADEVRAFLCKAPIVVKDTLSSQIDAIECEVKSALNGRKLLGSVPAPSYSGDAQGKVVVNIWVDNYGKVQKAIAGDAGTTVADQQLWDAARNAALKAHFNMSTDAPAMQEGTITFRFCKKEKNRLNVSIRKTPSFL